MILRPCRCFAGRVKLLLVLLVALCLMQGKPPTSSAQTATSPLPSSAPAANIPPTVSLFAPRGKTRHIVGVPLSIMASASDPDGAIAKVEFYEGSTKLAEVTSAPYEYVWRNPPVGTQLITGKATDNEGATTTSKEVRITTTALAASSNLPLSLSPYGDHPLAWWGSDYCDSWSVQALKDRAHIVKNPHPDAVNSSPTVGRFILRYSDNYEGFVNSTPRSEIYNYYTFHEGATYRYTFKTCIPRDFKFDRPGWQQRMIVNQLWMQRGLILDGSNYCVSVNDVPGVTMLGSALPDVGKWVSWEVELKASVLEGAEHSRFIIRKGGAQIHADNQATLHKESARAYVKWGPYKWDWKKYPTDIDEVVLYYDDLQVFDVTNNFHTEVMDFRIPGSSQEVPEGGEAVIAPGQ